MTEIANNNKITVKYILVTGLAVLFSWVLHEFAHWTAGNMLGYEMVMSLNKNTPVNGFFKSDKHYQLISAAGPFITLLQAFLVFFLMKKQKTTLLYPFLFSCFYMRLFATVISFRHLNDEARISNSLAIGTFTLPIIVTAVLLLLVYKTSVNNKFTFRFNLITLGLVIFFSSIIIMADQFLHIRLL
jgi:hypothetical protein